jgi:leucyl aminopeptidase
VALGHAASLATGRPFTWVQTVVECAELGLERAWPMPMLPEYRSAMDSEVADIKNVGGRGASALTAAAFLSDFVEHAEWAHGHRRDVMESSPSAWRAGERVPGWNSRGSGPETG